MVRSAVLGLAAALGMALPLSAQAYPPAAYPGFGPGYPGYGPNYPSYRPGSPSYRPGFPGGGPAVPPIGFPGGGRPFPPGPPSYYPPACDTWQVLYRRCFSEPWRVYGTFRHERLARRAAYDLRADGFSVRVSVAG
jgi:hypothetical protein